MAEVIGDYLPACEEDVVSDGREAWWRIKAGVKMMREDWLKVGRALSEGRAENPGNQAFSHWCDAHGFGDIPSNARTDAIWLIENKDRVLTLCQDSADTLNNPRVIRSAYRRLTKPKSSGDSKQRPKTKNDRTPGRIVSAIRDLSRSDWSKRPESLYSKATDKQRAVLREEIKHVRSFINRLSELLATDEPL